MMSEIRPNRRRATVLPRTYAWVIQMACSASAWRLPATCGSPTTTMRESRPAMSTPTVVTVRTVHLYLTGISSCAARTRFGRKVAFDWSAPKRDLYLKFATPEGPATASRDADALDRMVAGDQVARHPEVPALLPDCPALLRGLDRDGRMDHVPPMLDLDALHVEVPEHVRHEPIRLVRVLDDMDVFVHQALQLRDILALLADCLADLALLHDENEPVSRVDAIDDSRPREILEECDVPDRLLVKDNLGHDASGAEDVRLAGVEHGDRGDGKRDAARGAQVDVRSRESQHPDVLEVLGGFRRTVGGQHDELRALGLRRAADLAQAEPHIARVGREAEGSRDVDQDTTSSTGSSGSGVTGPSGVFDASGAGGGTTGAGFGFAMTDGFGNPAGGW